LTIGAKLVLDLALSLAAAAIVLAIQTVLDLRTEKKRGARTARRVSSLGDRVVSVRERVRTIEDAHGSLSRRVGVCEINGTKDAETTEDRLDKLERLVLAGNDSRQLLGLAGQFVAASCEDLNKRVSALEQLSGEIVFVQGGEGEPN